MGDKMEFYATLPPGIEDIASDEIEELGGKVFESRFGKGRVFFYGTSSLVPKLNFLGRSIERIVILLYRGYFQSLDEIYRKIYEIDFHFLENKTFAVRSLRSGVHNFTSVDVARVAGQAVIDSYLKAYGKRLKVNLNEPQVIIRVDVIENELFVGIDTTGDWALHKRWWRVYNHPAHLNSTIAYAMVKLADWNKNKTLLDPMCGSGTIPIEAALFGRKIPPNKCRDFAYFNIFGKQLMKIAESRENLEIYGIEKFEKHLRGARMNATNAGVIDTINFSLGDATKISGDYDCIITNPPYGLRIARKGIIANLYKKFCFAAKNCINDQSKLVVITSESKLMKRAIEAANLSVIERRYVRYGGLDTWIFTITL